MINGETLNSLDSTDDLLFDSATLLLFFTDSFNCSMPSVPLVFPVPPVYLVSLIFSVKRKKAILKTTQFPRPFASLPGCSLVLECCVALLGLTCRSKATAVDLTYHSMLSQIHEGSVGVRIYMQAFSINKQEIWIET